MSTFSFSWGMRLKATELLTATSAFRGPVDLTIPELADFAADITDNGTNRLKIAVDRQSGVGASNSQDYDLIGSLTDLESTTLNFDLVYFIGLYNLSATYGISIGPKASTTWGVASSNQGFWLDASDRSYVPPSSFLTLYSASGVPASAGSDTFQVITDSGSSANSWHIVIVGRDNA